MSVLDSRLGTLRLVMLDQVVVVADDSVVVSLTQQDPEKLSS